MKNSFTSRSKGVALALCVALLSGACLSPRLSVIYAKEPEDPGAESGLVEDAALSLDYVSAVTVDQEGSVVRIYGSSEKAYSHEISVTANATVILDHVKNEADLTVADGKEVCIILRGSNQLANVRATGGSTTRVRIVGGADGGTLTAQDVACSEGGSAQTGACLDIESCVIFCRNLGCGESGADVSTWEGSSTIARATPGSNASPYITVKDARLSVSGSMACGGNGVRGTGTWSAVTSSGGRSGAVEISGSYVTVGGNLAVGGKGGDGEIGSSYYDCMAGFTQASSPVTITDQSSVNVAGSVAGQPDLPSHSKEGSQSGLHGVTVTVKDSGLSAKDIAGGGAGHARVHASVYSGSGASYNIYGTAGGNGGVLIADHAVITCERAVCGANAGDYQKYEVSALGSMSGDVECVNHPQDGRGGSILATNSFLTIKSYAAAKGSRWDRYPNPSAYGDSTLIGGTLNGTIYGGVITTDMTSILGGGFIAADIRNSEEASCAKCTLKTAGALAGKTVSIRANALCGTVVLSDDGNMYTYLGIGKEAVKLTGAGVYSGTFMVKRSETLNVFQLEPYGVIHVDYDGAVISQDSYIHTNETYEYDGDFTVRGDSGDAAVTILEGAKRITLEDTSYDTLNVNGTSVVTLVLSGDSRIRAVNVQEHATLVIEGDGSLVTEHLGNENGKSGTIRIHSGKVQAGTLGADADSKEIIIRHPEEVEAGESRVPLRDENGNVLYPFELVLGDAGTYGLRFNDLSETVVLAEGETLVRKLLAAGAYAIEVTSAPFCFRGNVTIHSAQRIYLDDLMLYADASKGDLVIRDGEVCVGDETIRTDAEIRITQSGEQPGAVHVEKKTASVILDGVSPDIQIYLPEDFEGMIRDADNRPIQVVTVKTGFASKEMLLYLDGREYALTTNKAGNLSILTGRGMHTFGLTVDGARYRCKDAVSISGTEHVVRFSDMLLVWDVKDGDFKVTEKGFLVGNLAGEYTGAYLIVQRISEAENGMVTIEADADIFLSKEVDDLLQVKVREDFRGRILKEAVPLYPFVIATNCTNSAVKVRLDNAEGILQTDAEGKLYLVAAAGTHELVISAVDATDDGQSRRYLIVDGVPKEQPFVPEKPGSGNPGAGTGGNGGSSDGGAGGSSGGAPDGSGGGSASGNAKDAFSADRTDLSGRLPIDRLSTAYRKHDAGHHGAHTAKKPSIRMVSSLKGVKLVAAGERNTYQLYSRKKVRLTVRRENDTVYYYKIVRKGQRNSAVAWKKLDGETITVTPARRGQRVFIKAQNSGGITVKKTTGFVVDMTKPTIKGVKNAALYKGARMVSVSDEGGIADVRLNGKNMPKKFSVKKKGIYRLVVADCAGNRRQIFFALI